MSFETFAIALEDLLTVSDSDRISRTFKVRPSVTVVLEGTMQIKRGKVSWTEWKTTHIQDQMNGRSRSSTKPLGYEVYE